MGLAGLPVWKHGNEFGWDRMRLSNVGICQEARCDGELGLDLG